MNLLLVLTAIFEYPEPLEYANKWKGWYLIPILVLLLIIGYWVRRKRTK